MILKRLRLHPFAGTVDRTVEFAPGLNTLVGKNEAGKSTLVQALRKTLFTGTDLSAPKFAKEMKPFAPLPVGDTIRATLEFESSGTEWILTKCWNPAAPVCSLRSSDGIELTNPATVADKVHELLVFNQATYDNVLLTYQQRLSGTMDDLLEDRVKNTAELGAILRAVTSAAGGVSVEKLREACELEWKGAFGRWDRVADAPEDGRGISNPWKMGVGTILSAYYRWKRTEDLLARATVYETRIDQFVADMRVLQESLEQLTAYVESHRPLRMEAEKRMLAEGERQSLRKEMEELTTASREWPVSEAACTHLDEERNQLLEEHRHLKLEQQNAEAYLQQEPLRKSLEQAQRRHDALAEEQTKLDAMRQITDADIKALRDAESRIRDITIKIEAQHFALAVTARAPIHLGIAGLNESRETDIAAGGSFKTNLRGFVSVDHKDLTLRVAPSAQEQESLEQLLAEATARRDEQCRKLGVQSLEDALAQLQLLRDQKARVEQERTALRTITGRESFEAFQVRIAGLPDVRPGRVLAVINEQIEAVVREGKGKADEAKRTRERVAEYVARFGDQTHLQDELWNVRRRAEKHESELGAMSPLPPGVGDVRRFVREFDAKAETRLMKEREWNALRLERAEYEKHQPERPMEELQTEVDSLRNAFEEEKKKGEAYGRIRHELERLLAETDGNTYEPVQRTVEQLLNDMTLHRYGSVVMDGAVPVAVQRGPVTLSLPLLSTGMKDLLALAVRLAMAAYFLKDERGFVIMDDPLVNLDPERQELAVACIRSFALRRQVIILTCHPHHAELLGGSPVSLEPR